MQNTESHPFVFSFKFIWQLAIILVFGVLTHSAHASPGANVPWTTSVADDCPAENAVDGDDGTRWSSAHADNEWIYVDLGESKTINDVKLNWEHAAGKDYDIEVSDDAKTWQTVKSITNNSEMGWLNYPNLKTKGRYIRINCKTRTTEYGFSLWEFQVFGKQLMNILEDYMHVIKRH